MKILITGTNGQLAGEFIRTLKNSRHTISAPAEDHLDISSLENVSDAVSNFKPDIVINCAAYNQVDRAEDEFDNAMKVNADGVKNLAVACKKNSALLVHFSTDYVFDGTKNDFYIEEDEPNPINNYGRSKLIGEKSALEETDNLLLLRLSWVFGIGRQNFLYKLAEWAKRNATLKIVFDQVSVPTYTKDIVNYTLISIQNGLRGIYHLTNSGYASRYEVSKYFLERLGMRNLLLPVTSDTFKTAARRPYFSAMSNMKLSSELNVDIPDWHDAVDRFIKKMEGI
ncbi:MAG: dTDP-4-dehydrorhamnose reductase [Nitrospirae bacterium]|nr:dTDP-4-dehydrorhamnose reductase [Nitrospirota bacterium]